MKKLNKPIHIFFLCVSLLLVHAPAFSGVDGMKPIIKWGMIGGAAGLMAAGAISCGMFMKGLQLAAHAPGKKRYGSWCLMGTAVAIPIGALGGIARLLR